MTILSGERARDLLASLPRSTVCDLCRNGEPKNERPYGPFTIRICTACASVWDVAVMKLAATRAKLPPALLVADGWKHARNSAEIDWNWRRVGEFEFETPWLERVRYAGEGRHHLLSHRQGTRIFLGWCWYKRSDQNIIRELIRIGRLIEANPSGAPHG